MVSFKEGCHRDLPAGGQAPEAQQGDGLHNRWGIHNFLLQRGVESIMLLVKKSAFLRGVTGKPLLLWGDQSLLGLHTLPYPLGLPDQNGKLPLRDKPS